ncbi:MAG TPA: hypothetical protein VNE00_29755 [Paraburkholderia sp.]|nr:hypothetical protein [Paraburkholderia sp.]
MDDLRGSVGSRTLDPRSLVRARLPQRDAKHRRTLSRMFEQRTVGKETDMSESMLAYLLGPTVMAIVCVLMWLAARHHQKMMHREPRSPHLRWLDTYHGDWRHRH